jgi:hypothetical protein
MKPILRWLSGIAVALGFILIILLLAFGHFHKKASSSVLEKRWLDERDKEGMFLMWSVVLILVRPVGLI